MCLRGICRWMSLISCWFRAFESVSPRVSLMILVWRGRGDHVFDYTMMLADVSLSGVVGVASSVVTWIAG